MSTHTKRLTDIPHRSPDFGEFFIGKTTHTALVRQGGLVLLERVADAILSGRIDEQTDRHDHQQGHDTFGWFQLQRRGQKWRGFEEAQPAFSPGLAFVAVEHRLGG